MVERQEFPIWCNGQHRLKMSFMLLYLVRHAIAEDRAPGGADDPERRLTDKGIRKMRAHVRALGSLSVELDAIWTSPYRRAAQTAEILSEGHGFDGEVYVEDRLAPGGDIRGLQRALSAIDPDSALAFVGHEPDLGELFGMLLFSQGTSICRFKKGAVASIDYNPSDGFAQLHWLLTPRQMRMMV